MPLNLPDKPNRDDDDSVLKRRLLGAAVFIALAVIILPLVLDGSGSESRFRRVEQLRQEPPRVIDAGVQVTIPDKDKIPRPTNPATAPEPTEQAASATDSTAEPGSSTDSSSPITDDATTSKAPDTEQQTAQTQVENTDTTREAELQAAATEQVKLTPPADPVAEPEDITTEPASDEVIESVAWVIQVGSYADQTNALNLRNQLRDAGFPSFSSAAENAGAEVYRVKVGPISNRREAQEVQKQVESLIGQSTLIRKYP